MPARSQDTKNSDGKSADRLSDMSVTDLDTLIGLFERIKHDATESVVARVESQQRSQLPRVVADELTRSGRLDDLASAIVSKKVKFLLSLLGAATAILAIIGFTSITPVIENIAQRKVNLAIDRHKELLNGLEERIANSRDRLSDDQSDAVRTLTVEIAKVVRDAQRSVDETAKDAADKIETITDTAESAIDTKSQEAVTRLSNDVRASLTSIERAGSSSKTRLDETAIELEKRIRETGTLKQTELNTTSNSAERNITLIVDRAQKNIRDSVNDAIKKLNREAGRRSDSQQFGPIDELELYAELAIHLEGRDFAQAFDISKGLYEDAVDGDLPEQAAAGFHPIMINPIAFPERRLDAASMLLDERRSNLDRASIMSSVLIAGVRSGDSRLIELVDAEKKKNPLARIEWESFEDFFRAAAPGASSADELGEIYSSVNLDNLTHLGLANLLDTAKRAGMDPKVVEDLERRLMNNILTSDPVDRSTDYFLAWMLLSALASEPVFDREGVRSLGANWSAIVFSDQEADPWGIAKLLAELDGDSGE